MLWGIAIGIGFMLWTLLVFAIGYGWKDVQNKSTEEEE